MFNKIVVVCTGNICRSPIGEALLHQRLPGRQIISAGVDALVGYPADPLAQQVLMQRSIDISTHRAQQATLPLLSLMDLILTMDQSHSDRINSLHPHLRGKVYKLLKWRDNRDVSDPYRKPLHAFEHAYEVISQGVEDWAAKL